MAHDDLSCPNCGSENIEVTGTSSPVPDAAECGDCARSGTVHTFQ